MADFTRLRQLVAQLEEKETAYDEARAKAASDAALATAAAATATASKGLEDAALADERTVSGELLAEIETIVSGN